MTERHCIVLAGGHGTRISAVTKDLLPKALVQVVGRPFLDYKIDSLIKMGVSHIWIIAGHHGNQIEAYVERLPQMSPRIHVLHDGDSLRGTGGAIARHIKYLPEKFWVTYADTYVLAPVEHAERHFDSLSMRVMCVLHNKDAVETSNVNVTNDMVTTYSKGMPKGALEWIDYGLLRLDRSDFATLPEHQPIGLEDVIQSLISKRLLGAWFVKDPFWEIGTPLSKKRTEDHFLTQDWSEIWK
jgi:NDP-sugar pyrophosphorylase family protein